MLALEEYYWRQRSRVEWLRGGYKNTKIFHLKASHRRWKNLIRGIEDEDGRWLTSEDDIVRSVEAYFNGIFTSILPGAADIERVAQVVVSSLSVEMRELLD